MTDRKGADLPETMMALRAHTRGGPEQLVYEQAPVPAGRPGEVLVAVHAAGITFAELSWDLPWTTSDGTDRTPVIPAHELSGIVARTGPGVSDPAAGDPVLGLIDFDRDGAAAEFVTVPAANLATKPPSVPHPVAAGLPLAGGAAWAVRCPARGHPRRPCHPHQPRRHRQPVPRGGGRAGLVGRRPGRSGRS